MSSKRARIGSSSYSSSGSSQRRARIVGAKLAQQFPKDRYGKMHIHRGTPDGLALFGPSYKSASVQQQANRRSYGYFGQGRYTGKGGYLMDAAKELSGTYRELMPKSWRQSIVSRGNDFLKGGSYSGQGGYNALVSAPQHSVVMQRGDETNSITITNREYIGDLYTPASGQFFNHAYALNPGIQSVFPWLSQIASNYDQYKFEQLVFEYHPTISETSTSTNGQPGQVMLCTNYNPSTPIFQDKEAMVQYHGGQSDRLTSLSVHGVECDDKKVDNPLRYVRNAPVIVGQDLKSFDLGLFQIAFSGVPTSFQQAPAGELWVYYTVRLTTPKLGVSRGNLIQTDIFLDDSATIATSKSLKDLFTTDPLVPSSTQLWGQQNNIGAVIFNNSSGGYFNMTIQLPPSLTGSFEATLRLGGLNDGTVTVDPELQMYPATMGYAGNVTLIKDIYADGDSNNVTPSHINTGRDSQGVNFIAVAHFSVRAQTGVTKNSVYFSVQISPMTTTTLKAMSCYITLVERNPLFQTSNSVTAPLWINASGTITTPLG